MIKISFTIVVFIFLALAACNNDEADTSPYSDILSRPPYASLTDSIKKQPKNDELYFRRAVLLNKNNLPEAALADFQKAWSLHKYEEYAFGVSNAWMDKKPDSSVIFLEGALKEIPESYLLRLSLARAYDALNRTGDALKVCDALLQAIPDEPDVLVFKSELQDKKGDSSGALLSMGKAYSLVPGNTPLGFKLAYKYAESKNRKALSLCDSLIRGDSLKLYAEPYYIKGIYYANTGDKANALRMFDETIRHSYNYLNAYVEKGKILVDQKKPAEAYTVFQLANRIKPAFPDAYYWMGVCQEALGQKTEARQNYEKAYELDKTFTEAKEAKERLSK